MKYFVQTLTLLVLLFVGIAANAQDPHFSQFYQSPMTLNPALSGLMNYNVRIGANYRNQWSSVTKAYQTFAVAADGNFFREKLGGDMVGAGLVIQNDQAGDANLRSTAINLNMAYHKSLSNDNNHFITAGINIGAVQRSLDFSKLFFESQYNGNVLDPNQPSNEVLDRTSFWYFDIGAGLNWFYVPDEKHNFYAGLALNHIAQPNQSFYSTGREQVYRKFTLHAGAEFAMGDRFAMIPMAVYMKQGPANEANFGLMLKFKLGSSMFYEDSKNAFYVGTTYRVGDAQVLQLRLDLKALTIGMSYDFNLSDLNRASNGFGGPEVSLMYKIGEHEPMGGVKCPSSW